MSEREELEAVIEGAVKSLPMRDCGDPGGELDRLRRCEVVWNTATALIEAGYTKGNGELVEAVRPAIDWLDRYIDEFGELCSDDDDAAASYEAARKALSDSEGVASSGGGDLRGPVAWLVADPDLMDESEWTIESDPVPESHGVSMPLHIHPDHAATFDALIESAGSKRPYHAILAARSAAQDTQRSDSEATNGDQHDEG